MCLRAPLLHQGVDRGATFVRLLVERGGKLDIKDATGRTPLDIAIGVVPTVPREHHRAEDVLSKF